MRTPSLRTSPNLAILAAAVVLVVAAGSGGAVAGALITGKQIKDESVTGADIRNGSLTAGDLSPAAQRQLRGALVSGVVDLDGNLVSVRSGPGIKVTTGRLDEIIGGYCIKVDGAGITPQTAGMTVSTDLDDSIVGGVEIRPTSKSPCGAEEWTVYTYRLPKSAGGLDRSDAAFTFQIG